MKKIWFVALFGILLFSSCKEDRPFFRVDFWEINNMAVGTDSYFAADEILKIKVRGATENNSNIDRKISHFSFGYEVDGAQGDANGEFDQDANEVTITYILDLQEMFKDGSLYYCIGGEVLTVYLELVDYNGNAETYTHTIHIQE